MFCARRAEEGSNGLSAAPVTNWRSVAESQLQGLTHGFLLGLRGPEEFDGGENGGLARVAGVSSPQIVQPEAPVARRKVSGHLRLPK